LVFKSQPLQKKIIKVKVNILSDLLIIPKARENENILGIKKKDFPEIFTRHSTAFSENIKASEQGHGLRLILKISSRSVMMGSQVWFYIFVFTILDLIICDKFISRPYFGDAETDVTVQQGEAAFFNCHVFNLANQTVSWMRTSDGYPLFIGNEKYINDQRFELLSRR